MLVVHERRGRFLGPARSYERALDESLFSSIRKMETYRNAAQETKVPRTVHLETGSVTLAQLQRLQKYFPFKDVRSLDAQVAYVRSVKSPCELALMEEAGRIHRRVLEDCVPAILVEGMDEIELNSDLYSLMVREGHQGMMRFGLFNEMLLGQVCFGTSSISPSCVNTRAGSSGCTPRSP
jgi:Xaa-Pro aminopeptidase